VRQPSRLSVNVVLYAVLAWHRIQRGHLQRPAEWPKLLRAARASLQVAGLLYGPGSGIGGSIRPVPGPIAGSRLGRPSRSAGQAGVFQAPQKHPVRAEAPSQRAIDYHNATKNPMI